MKVSVLIITYNQEKFITKALESALGQRTEFEYEVVVGEDNSSDRTRDILTNLKKKNPDKLRLLLHNKNLGMLKNFAATLDACRGQYITILDGDDYWTTSNKLQKQVNFLDSHPDCTICFHPVRTENKDGHYLFTFPQRRYRKPFSTLRDLLKGNFISTSSVMFRQGLFPRLPDWYYLLSMGDWSLHILNAQHGKIGCIDETMAAYRLHEYGVWSSSNRIRKLKDSIRAYEVYNAHLEFHYNRMILAQIALLRKDIIIECENCYNLSAINSVWNINDYLGAFRKRDYSLIELLHLALKLYTPPNIIKAWRKLFLSQSI